MTRPTCQLALLFVVGCALPGEEPREAGKTLPVSPEILAELKPWHPFKTERAAEATVIVKATYSQGRGPCIFKDDGSIAMPATQVFHQKQVFKGELGCSSFEAGLHSDGVRFPEQLIERRTYLLFLKPSKASAARLKETKAELSFHPKLGGDEIVAIVDLSQSLEKAESFRVQATESGTYNGFTFTPEKWKAQREAKTVDRETQKQFQAFIENVVAPFGATMRQVRSYLGPPDYWYQNSDGLFYQYYLDGTGEKKQGDLCVRLEIQFRNLRLARCQFTSWTYESKE